MAKKVDKEKQIKAVKKLSEDFKSFISRGNVVDMAVGVIIGGAFGKIVTSLVNDVLTPLIGVFLGGLNFSELSFGFKDAQINYGLFIQTIVDFLIIISNSLITNHLSIYQTTAHFFTNPSKSRITNAGHRR